LLLLGAATGKAQELDPDQVTIVTNDVSAGLYYLEGNGGNIGLSVGDDGVFMIDDQFAPLTAKIKATIDDLSNEPVKFVFNTHFHFDHSDGNENFGAGGALIVAHENARTRMSSDQLISVLNQPQLAYDEVGLPKITFTDEMTLHFNGNTMQVHHFGSGHTDTDAIYHFVEANVIHTGDVFVRYGLPFIDVPNGGNLNGMIRAMHEIIALADDNTKVIPGHGQLSTKADMEAYVQMLETIRDRVYAGITAGMSLDEITATVPTRDYPQEGFINNAAFSKIAYDSFFK
jgi:glyoxylase-like metal-dependent hydrolase (beta-lactamase superfamily II)